VHTTVLRPASSFADISEPRARRLREQLAASPYDAVVCCGGENVWYATGYRSAPGSHRRRQSLAALVTPSGVLLVGPAGEAAQAMECGVSPDGYVPYGLFHFESACGEHPAATCSGRHDSLASAVRHAAGFLGSAAVIGVDEADCPVETRRALEHALPRAGFRDATAWLQHVRSVKLPGEVERLRHAARLAEDGITAAIETADDGTTERELAAAVAQVMTAGGAIPRAITATVGTRSALSDVFPTDAAIREGDLVRFDVTCVFDGYRADIGRTAVAGAPDALQRDRYDAIRQGEEREIEACRPGLAAAALFDQAVRTVEDAGLRPYRRNHCGHGIGMEIYEGFRVAPGDDHVFEPGNVLCVETPYYVLGWGGMMVEDALLVTESGAEPLTRSTRELRVIA
jgi:Xaa-Pro dipeptidase